jgi:hypothetical protein
MNLIIHMYFVRMGKKICFLPFFNCKAPIIICHVFIDTVKIFSTESYHACLNITRVRIVFKIHGQKAITFLYLWLFLNNC